MIIRQHKGIEADQSHNYIIEVNRTELGILNRGLNCMIDENIDANDNTIVNNVGSMRKELDKFVENK